MSSSAAECLRECLGRTTAGTERPSSSAVAVFGQPAGWRSRPLDRYRQRDVRRPVSIVGLTQVSSNPYVSGPQLVGARLTEMSAAGDFYKAKYEGYYCVGCEAFKSESELTEDGLCPDHLIRPEWIEEKNYFFRLSAYQERLERHFTEHPDFVQPDYRRNEMLGFIEDAYALLGSFVAGELKACQAPCGSGNSRRRGGSSCSGRRGGFVPSAIPNIPWPRVRPMASSVCWMRASVSVAMQPCPR